MTIWISINSQDEQDAMGNADCNVCSFYNVLLCTRKGASIHHKSIGDITRGNLKRPVEL